LISGSNVPIRVVCLLLLFEQALVRLPVTCQPTIVIRIRDLQFNGV
jgi:hypothetical protein